MVSLGNEARSTRATRWPLPANNIANDAPAHRPPTITTSYKCVLLDSPVSFTVSDRCVAREVTLGGVTGGQGLHVRRA